MRWSSLHTCPLHRPPQISHNWRWPSCLKDNSSDFQKLILLSLLPMPHVQIPCAHTCCHCQFDPNFFLPHWARLPHAKQYLQHETHFPTTIHLSELQFLHAALTIATPSHGQSLGPLLANQSTLVKGCLLAAKIGRDWLNLVSTSAHSSASIRHDWSPSELVSRCH